MDMPVAEVAANLGQIAAWCDYVLVGLDIQYSQK